MTDAATMAPTRRERFRESGIPLIAFALTVLAAAALYSVLVESQSALLRQRTGLALEVAEQTIEAGMRQRIEALARLGQRMSVPGVEGNEVLFRAGARQFLLDFEGLIAVGWRPAGQGAGLYEARDPRYATSLATPLLGAGAGDSPRQQPLIEREARAGEEPIARVAVPEWRADGTLAGHVLAAFHYKPLFDQILLGLPSGFEMAVEARGETIYVRPAAAPPPLIAPFALARERTYFGESLELHLWPAQRTFAVFRSRLPVALFGLGIAIGLLFAAALRFFAQARRRAQQAEEAVARMRVEADQRAAAQNTLAMAHDALRRRNEELQDFAFAASHDLQEPLRKIRAFGDRLQERYAAQLDGAGRDYIERMQGAAGRMQSLIEALLEYSRVATKARPLRPVDLNQIAHEVVADLETAIEAADAEVILGALPVVIADAVHMRQLLQNLISNALKFRAPARRVQVRVSAFPIPRDGRPWCRLQVTDNGIGFDNQYAERIFAPFKRLHGRDQYDGTGIGLAIVRRIVERHQGFISAEGRPGEGATFTVDLPAGGETGSTAQLSPTPPAAS